MLSWDGEVSCLQAGWLAGELRGRCRSSEGPGPPPHWLPLQAPCPSLPSGLLVSDPTRRCLCSIITPSPTFIGTNGLFLLHLQRTCLVCVPWASTLLNPMGPGLKLHPNTGSSWGHLAHLTFPSSCKFP